MELEDRVPAKGALTRSVQTSRLTDSCMSGPACKHRKIKHL